MNRYIKKTALILIFLMFIGIIIWVYFPAIDKISISRGAGEKKENKTEDYTYIQNAYSPLQDEFLEFKIPSTAKLIKIVSNVPFCYNPFESEYSYAIEYELFDKLGKNLYSNSYFQNGKVRLYKEKGTNRILSEPFLVDKNLYLTKNSEIVIPLKNFNKPSLLKIKWNSTNKFPMNLLIRVSRYSEKTETTDENPWLRLTEDKRNEISQSSVFPESEIKKEEIKKALIKNWKLMTASSQNEKIIPEFRIGRLPLFKVRNLKLPFKKRKVYSLDSIKSEVFRLYLESAEGTFKIPALKNIRKAETLFKDLFNKKEITPEMEENFAKLGFSLKQIQKTNNLYIVISELEGHKEGKGFYIFCRNSKNKNCALEMPHRFFDDKTGIIGLKMFFSGNFSAAAWNTVHRYQTPNNMSGSSDMAHNSRSYFNAFTRAFLNSEKSGDVLIQLHGFNEIKHKVGVEESQAILSEGVDNPSEKFLALCKAIESILKIKIFIYPIDIESQELSARENITLKSFSKSKTQKIFVHFEMNSHLRKLFISDKDLPETFSRTLNEAAGRLLDE